MNWRENEKSLSDFLDWSTPSLTFEQVGGVNFRLFQKKCQKVQFFELFWPPSIKGHLSGKDRGQFSTFSKKMQENQKVQFFEQNFLAPIKVKDFCQNLSGKDRVSRVSKNARKSEVTKVKIFWKVMIFVKIFIFLAFSQKQLTFDLKKNPLSWNKMSGVKKYVYNCKGIRVQKWLKKKLLEKICPKKLNFCWFLKPFISSTNNARHVL